MGHWKCSSTGYSQKLYFLLRCQGQCWKQGFQASGLSLTLEPTLAIFIGQQEWEGSDRRYGSTAGHPGASFRKSLEHSEPVKSGVISSLPGLFGFTLFLFTSQETPGQHPFLSLQQRPGICSQLPNILYPLNPTV